MDKYACSETLNSCTSCDCEERHNKERKKNDHSNCCCTDNEASNNIKSK